MSLTIIIGNKTPNFNTEEFEEEPFVINTIELKNAPYYPNDYLTRNKNTRLIRYCFWKRFCEYTKLNDLFYTPPLITKHTIIKYTTITEILPEHINKLIFTKAIMEMNEKDLIPGFALKDINQYEELFKSGYNVTTKVYREVDEFYALLMWLKWWVEWTINNCDNPAIYIG